MAPSSWGICLIKKVCVPVCVEEEGKEEGEGKEEEEEEEEKWR